MTFTHATSEASALQTLRPEIRRCPALHQKLKDLSANANQRVHYYNAQQVRVLFEYFGVGIDR
ncbi:DUF4248 domain-containing protein [Persicobacter psychrovividus]|uniref:DUF4248 domain-containing protein n=1 Tax=Persicobacter psychrovividus TaxID=387638 RepID=UPI003BAC774F